MKQQATKKIKVKRKVHVLHHPGIKDPILIVPEPLSEEPIVIVPDGIAQDETLHEQVAEKMKKKHWWSI